MSTNLVLSLKIGLGLIWLLALAAFALPADTTAGLVGRLVFWVMLGAHALECLVFLPGLRATGKPLPGQLVQVLLFGIAHYASVRPPAQASEGGS